MKTFQNLLQQKWNLRPAKMKRFISIGNRIKLLRGKLSQAKFAEKLGTSLRAYQLYEAGDRAPKEPTLQKIAQICDVTVDWLLTGNTANKKEREI